VERLPSGGPPASDSPATINLEIQIRGNDEIKHTPDDTIDAVPACRFGIDRTVQATVSFDSDT